MYDYIIAGAGPAGCVLAHRLTEDPQVKVLLIEAGGRDWHPLLAMPAGFAKMTKGIASWGWSTVPQKHMKDRVFWYTQAKVMGGGSSINAQIYTRGNRADYDAWAFEEHCSGWGYADVLSYFKRAEDNQKMANAYHGIGGPIGVRDPINPVPIDYAFIKAGQQAGMPYNPDFNGASQEGVGLYQVTIRNARRSSASKAYIDTIRNRRNLTVRTQTQCLQVLVENGRATGIVVRSHGATGNETLRADRDIIISSGAIGTPRLLQLSGIGPADELRALGIASVHHLPGVGKNLQDHLDLYTIGECSGDHTYDRVARPHRTLWAGLQYILFQKGPVASSLFETGGFATADPSARSPDIQFHLGLGSGIEAGVDRLKNPGVTINSAFLRPRSRGSVTLKSANPADAPLIDPNYWADPYDREISLKGLRMAMEILNQDAFKPFLLAQRMPNLDKLSDEDLIAYACHTAKTDHHPAGTCRMGHDDMAVVEPGTLKLRGLEGLRICDASIMPRLTSCNTNAPTVMIGEKGADLIRGLPPLPSVNLPN
ncbi:MAG: GMC family oxidoreductase N-terminal domain-containing protein [Hyphomicrobiales bacterium]|nr:GMC family oxidoreductase N-terminal domain-containing protein [Hyphomicrobiales bacterium]MDE2113551.1 GMC family oxidoreductase N-terminal domain-containing protein [Hyphomicrobiales bacterium]